MFCPQCNGTERHRETCSCGAIMRDAGPVADYYGPYSPYFSLAFEQPVCVHLFACPACGRDRRVTVNLIR
ncbi:hypothetical protein GFC01_11850 [Desulfofundulus thermobenzoicus]|uniref:Uncharacterized protein n=1 Tax=Desulfofundulus thermobenzoicus TaxID=29376 RepID=A0A6N7ISA9_9FIRM|nr:hypothetical protein [Desulfofundulus thermobenzoicus]MQL52940.1 hypothetical protein [Desulfofundulus thermobenzoicus]